MAGGLKSLVIERGAVVVCVLAGDFGKPRPAVVVQSDLFNSTHGTITVCPLTSQLVDAPLFRIRIAPRKSNGLKKRSDVMVDKVTGIRRERITETIGSLNAEELQAIDEALARWLGLNDF